MEPEPDTRPLPGWRGARPPDRSALSGARVRVEPLGAEHDDGLWAAASAVDEHLWDHLPYGPWPDRDGFRSWLRERRASDDPRFYAVVPTATGIATGMLALQRFDVVNGVIEVGHIWFGPGLRRTTAATEALALVARHVFEDLGHRRLEWKCNAANARSRRAAVRLGFGFEGIFRQHQVVKGHNRDTAWYSILDREWPAVRRAYDAWLDPANFDPAGRQRRSLHVECR